MHVLHERPGYPVRLSRAKGVATDTTKKICALIQRLENAVYTGDDTKPADAATELMGLVKRLEKDSR